MQHIPIVAGKWYFTVTCKNPECAQCLIVGLAPSPKEWSGVYAWPISIDCECGTHSKYQPSEVQRTRAARLR
jgi:hypothetical protein